MIDLTSVWIVYTLLHTMSLHCCIQYCRLQKSILPEERLVRPKTIGKRSIDFYFRIDIVLPVRKVGFRLKENVLLFLAM